MLFVIDHLLILSLLSKNNKIQNKQTKFPSSHTFAESNQRVSHRTPLTDEMPPQNAELSTTLSVRL